MSTNGPSNNLESWAVSVVVALIGAATTVVVALVSKPTAETPPNPGPPAPSAPAPDSGASILGSYKIVGANPGGGSYRGTLDITALGSAYQLLWNAAEQPYIGIGILAADYLAVGWGSKRCGVALYQVQANQSLDGQWVTFGQDKVGTEVALPTAASAAPAIAGDYRVTGQYPNGSAYGEVLSVQPAGALYRVQWQNSATPGVALQQGDVVAVGFGPDRCNVVLYKVQADGSLSGLWGYSDGGALGTEEAVR